MRLFRYLMGIVGCCCCLAGMAQQSFYIMEYNVENFFDCRHDSLKEDFEFLPGGEYGWTPYRMRAKQKHIAQVILAASDRQCPDLVGLCEVENDNCVNGLVRFSPLRALGYRYVMTDSPDRRGIDVALLYRPSRFRLLGSRSARVSSEQIGMRPTRDVLHAYGRMLTGDTLDVIVCHFPSRAGGERASESHRVLAARTVRRVCDSLTYIRQNPYLIVMGDFNEGPNGLALRSALRAHPFSGDALASSGELYNLMGEKNGGTYRYRGHWETIDQFLVSGSLLLPGARIATSSAEAEIVRLPFLFEEDERYGGETPYRTYYGRTYRDAFSDHLPILLHLRLYP